MSSLSDSTLSCWNWWLGWIALVGLILGVASANGILAIVVAILGLISAIGVLFIGRTLERRRNMADANRLAELKAAKEVAEQAHTTASKLEEKQRPRMITDEQRNNFVMALGSVPRGKVNVIYACGDTETHDFARQINDLMRFAGFDTPQQIMSFSAWMSWGPPPRGVRVCVRDLKAQPQHAGMVMLALQQIGIKARPQVADARGSDNVMVALGYKELDV